MAEVPIASGVMAFSSPAHSDCIGRVPGWRRTAPRTAVRRDCIEKRQRLRFREAQEELPHMLAEILLGNELAPVFAVVDDRARVRIELHSVVLDPREDGVTVPRDLDVLRIDSLRPVQAVEGPEPAERRLDERVRWDVGAGVLQGQRSEANGRGTRLFSERLDT